MRSASAAILAGLVLVALWPTLCVSSEDGSTSCQSAVFLPLPWGESADTWGIAVAVAAALVTYFAVRDWLGRSARRRA